MEEFCTFIAKYDSGSLLKAYQSRNFTKMGQIYNGDGNTYGPSINQIKQKVPPDVLLQTSGGIIH
jgi:hypothetical protein